MNFTLHIKPISVNAAFQGRRFKTRECKNFENHVRWLLPKPEKLSGKYVSIEYRFFLRNFSLCDIDNHIKILQDCIVKRGLIMDDRLIIEMRVRKFPSKVDRIEVEIEAATLIQDWMVQ